MFSAPSAYKVVSESSVIRITYDSLNPVLRICFPPVSPASLVTFPEPSDKLTRTNRVREVTSSPSRSANRGREVTSVAIRSAN